jgi:hypothetical protein
MDSAGDYFYSRTAFTQQQNGEPVPRGFIDEPPDGADRRGLTH